MKGNVFTLVCAILISLSTHNFAQDNQTLIDIAGNKVSKSEFERVYKKNNNKDISFDNKAVREYLDLYINYKLKVRAAEDLYMDTAAAFRNELSGYRKQLAQPYLSDKDVSDALIQEAYNRMQKDVRASHILVKLNAEALPKDTLVAYNKAMKIREKLLKGGDFAKMARDSSDDPSAKENGGDLGYFTSMQMVYPFESAAYTTPIGKISMPVRTRFGYHIIKVTDMRDAQGEIKVAHIMVKVPAGGNDNDSANLAAKSKIMEIAAKLKAGESFASLAEQFSDDKGSAKNGGELPFFGTGRMVPEFEKAAFALKADGDVTEPVKSSYGWHIIKRIEKKAVPTFEEKKADLKQQISRDSRSEVSKMSMINKIKKEYGFTENAASREEVLLSLDSNVVKGDYAPDSVKSWSKTICTIGTKTLTQQNFAEYIVTHQIRRTSGEPYAIGYALYEGFVNDACIEYEEGRLEQKHDEFKNLMQEYRDGILLFDLTDKMVWSKAVKDTVGLKEFYERNKTNYMWGERTKATVYTCENAEVAEAVRKLIKKKMADADILTEINKDSQLNLTIKEGKFAKGENENVDAAKGSKGLSPNVEKNNQVVFVNIIENLPAMPKAMDEAKGLITADYQNYLEKNWITELRKKYTVTVNEPLLQTIIK
jgi:peptidyl-prolyl cis-trans isomerase SurA